VLILQIYLKEAAMHLRSAAALLEGAGMPITAADYRRIADNHTRYLESDDV
jgi:hypothetical protein